MFKELMAITRNIAPCIVLLLLATKSAYSFETVTPDGFRERWNAVGDKYLEKFSKEASQIEAAALSKDCGSVKTQYQKLVSDAKAIQSDPGAENPLYYNLFVDPKKGAFDCLIKEAAGPDVLVFSYFASLSVDPKRGIDPLSETNTQINVEGLIASLNGSGRSADARQIAAYEAVVRPKQRELLGVVRDRSRSFGNGYESEVNRLALEIQVNEIVASVLSKRGATIFVDLYAFRSRTLDDVIDSYLVSTGRDRGNRTINYGPALALASSLNASVTAIARTARGGNVNQQGRNPYNRAEMDRLLSATMQSLSGNTKTGGDGDVSIADSLNSSIDKYMQDHK